MSENQPLIYFSIKQAAKYLKIPYENFRYHVNKNHGPPIAAVQGEMRMFTKSDLDDWKLGKILRRKAKNKNDCIN